MDELHELHEHGPTRPGGYSAEYPGMPDYRQGETVGHATYILGDTNQLSAVPPDVYAAWSHGRETMEQALEEECEFHFTDDIPDGALDQADDGMSR